MSNLELQQMFTRYSDVIVQWYPEGKKRGDGDACMASRQSLFERLCTMDRHQLSLHQLWVCALAYDACVFSEKTTCPEVIGFRYEPVNQMLQRILSICKSEALIENILDCLTDLEFRGTYGQWGFLPTTEKMIGKTVNDRTLGCSGGVLPHRDMDEFERAQTIDESGSEFLGLDEENPDEE